MERKNKLEKNLAKVVYYTAITLTIIAVIVLFATLGAMVEAMAITKARAIICTICTIWLVAVAIMVYLLER